MKRVVMDYILTSSSIAEIGKNIASEQSEL